MILYVCLCHFCQHWVILKMTKVRNVWGYHMCWSELDICTSRIGLGTSVTPVGWSATPGWPLDKDPIQSTVAVVIAVVDVSACPRHVQFVIGQGSECPGQGVNVSDQKFILHDWQLEAGIAPLWQSPWSMVPHKQLDATASSKITRPVWWLALIPPQTVILLPLSSIQEWALHDPRGAGVKLWSVHMLLYLVIFKLTICWQKQWRQSSMTMISLLTCFSIQTTEWNFLCSDFIARGENCTQ